MFDTSIGSCALAWSEDGLTAFQLPEESPKKTKERLLEKSGERGAPAAKMPGWVQKLVASTKKHLDGQPQSFEDVPLDLEGVTRFNASVYRALQKVPSGKTVTYGELAKHVGSPGAARAIGTAMATNPIPLVVPCHRVLGASGKGGFSAYGGVVTKDRLLAIEGAGTPSLFAPKAAANDLPYDRKTALAHLSASDAILRDHVAKVGAYALSLKQTNSTFYALAESIVYQQLNGKAAATIFGRVQALFPKGNLEPGALLRMDDERLRGAGLSKNKLLALRDLAERSEQGKVPTLAQLNKMSDDEIVDRLTEVRGIGRWTVEMLLIFRLGRPDVLPVADYGIKKGYARLFFRGKKKEELPTDAELLKRGERWRPFRSVASWYLWRATDMA